MVTWGCVCPDQWAAPASHTCLLCPCKTDRCDINHPPATGCRLTLNSLMTTRRSAGSVVTTTRTRPLQRSAASTGRSRRSQERTMSPHTPTRPSGRSHTRYVSHKSAAASSASRGSTLQTAISAAMEPADEPTCDAVLTSLVAFRFSTTPHCPKTKKSIPGHDIKT